MKILSLFSGAGGLDLGFEKAGFNITIANEFDPSIVNTYRYNHKNTELLTSDIRNLKSENFPNDIDGIIGGPPCQAFSEAGKGLGINDKRGRLFFEYIKIVKDKKPLFFLAENVSGMLHKKHSKTVYKILQIFEQINYKVFLLNIDAYDYGIPQNRKRIFYIGFRKELEINNFDLKKSKFKTNLKDAIYDLKNNVVSAEEFNKSNKNITIANHEYAIGSFSSRYMARNRVRSWDEPSFTIQASSRHIPLHPQAPKMILVEKDKRIFVKGSEHLYRRLSIRECARIQTFPDDFLFEYSKLEDAYKMIGNAVPPLMAFHLANAFRKVFNLKQIILKKEEWNLPYIKDKQDSNLYRFENQLNLF